MARRPRIEFPGALYHVISRGNQGQRIFRASPDYGHFRRLLEQYQSRYGFYLYAYALMPNHLHLLVETGTTPLSKIMQGLQQSYTLYFNRRYDIFGHLFRGRYKALLCQKDAYLLELVRYLHLNPVRAGLVKTPEAYPWSSHRIYLEGGSRAWVAVAPVLTQFSRDRARAIAAYRKFLFEGRRQGHRPELYQAKDQRYLGEEDFIAQIERQMRRREPRHTVRTSIPSVVAAVSRVTGVSLDRLKAPGRYRRDAQARALVAHVAREVGGIPLGTVAHYFRRDQATLSLAVRKLQEQQASDPDLRALVKRVGGGLRRAGRGKI